MGTLTISTGIKRAVATIAVFFLLSLCFALLFSFDVSRISAVHSACSDGIDNDADGRTDYPADEGCVNLDDDSEGTAVSSVFVTVTDDRDSVTPGGNLVYVITLRQQSDDQRTVQVDLHLPFQSNAVSASDGGAVSPSHVRWTGVTLHRNVTKTLQVHANIRHDAVSGEYMVARVIAGGAEDTDTTLLEGFVPEPQDVFEVSITDNKEFAQPGEELRYVMSVRNTSNRSVRTDVRLGMPYETFFVSNSVGGTRDSYTVTWPDIVFQPGERLSFEAIVRIDPYMRTQNAIRARVIAGTRSAVDRTDVNVGVPANVVTASITDDRETARVGEILTYTIVVRNASDATAANLTVSAGLPLYAEFVRADEGGFFDGTNVRWLTNVGANGSRTLSFAVRVRSDAPEGHVLTAAAVAGGIDGFLARDRTTVGERSTGSSASSSSSSRTRRDPTGSGLLRKFADREEVVPGSKVRYTLTVRNTYDYVLSETVILDRYDERYLSLVSYDDPGALISQSPGLLRWQVPFLRPGEIWETSYILAVARDIPAGLDLGNVATISGPSLEQISLRERVHTIRAAVMHGGIPKAGVATDLLLGFGSMLGATLSFALQSKKGFRRASERRS